MGTVIEWPDSRHGVQADTPCQDFLAYATEVRPVRLRDEEIKKEHVGEPRHLNRWWKGQADIRRHGGSSRAAQTVAHNRLEKTQMSGTFKHQRHPDIRHSEPNPILPLSVA